MEGWKFNWKNGMVEHWNNEDWNNGMIKDWDDGTVQYWKKVTGYRLWGFVGIWR